MKGNEHYDAYKEGILRARLIRKDLKNHPTEYYPEKVRGLNKSYIATVKEIIKQGEKFVKSTDNPILKVKVQSAIENYRAFLSTLK